MEVSVCCSRNNVVQIFGVCMNSGTIHHKEQMGVVHLSCCRRRCCIFSRVMQSHHPAWLCVSVLFS